MFAQTLKQWLRRSSRPAKTTKMARSRRWRRLSLECLEERVLPATQIDFGGLRFVAPNGFSPNGDGDQTASTGIVSNRLHALAGNRRQPPTPLVPQDDH